MRKHGMRRENNEGHKRVPSGTGTKTQRSSSRGKVSKVPGFNKESKASAKGAAPTKLVDHVSLAMKAAKELLDATGEVLPMGIVVGRDNMHHPYGLADFDPQDKVLALKTAKKLMKEHDGKAWIFMNEAWLGETQEAIIVAGFSKKSKLMQVLAFDRNEGEVLMKKVESDDEFSDYIWDGLF